MFDKILRVCRGMPLATPVDVFKVISKEYECVHHNDVKLVRKLWNDYNLGDIDEGNNSVWGGVEAARCRSCLISLQNPIF